MSNLDGATGAPLPGTECANAGEFAAYWNSLEPEQREDMVKSLRTAAERSLACFIENHVERLAPKPTRLAGLIEIRQTPDERYSLRIDGEEFPWFVAEGLSTSVQSDEFPMVTLSILAEGISLEQRALGTRL